MIVKSESFIDKMVSIPIPLNNLPKIQKQHSR
jgi:hypothetical protein